MINQINADLKIAMKSKDTFKLSVLRMLKSALQLEQIAKKKELDDNEAIAVLKKQLKLRKDSIEEYKNLGKLDTVVSLEEEAKIISNYLPEDMSLEEINKVLDEVFNEVNPTGMKDMGIVMKTINQKLVGKNADMSVVNKLVREALNK